MNPYEILEQLFSGNLKTNGVTVKAPEKVSLAVNKVDDFFIVTFSEKIKVNIHKVIRLDLSISGVKLGKTGGIFLVDFFPDIPFDYPII